MVGGAVGGMVGAISAYKLAEMFPEPYDKLVLAGETALVVGEAAILFYGLSKKSKEDCMDLGSP